MYEIQYSNVWRVYEEKQKVYGYCIGKYFVLYFVLYQTLHYLRPTHSKTLGFSP